MAPNIQSRLQATVNLVAGVAMIVTAGVVLWAKFSSPQAPPSPTVSTPRPTPPPEAIPAEPQPLDGAFAQGSQSAPIGLVEFADLECPACAAFARTTYPLLMTRYVDTGRVRLFFRHFPLPNHAFARSAAIGAQCAGEQGGFWGLYETVYRLQPRLDDAGLRAVARKVGLDVARWSRCLAAESAEAAVDRDFEAARGLGLQATPTFLVGAISEDGRLHATGRIRGAQPLPAFEAAIAEAEKTLASGK